MLVGDLRDNNGVIRSLAVSTRWTAVDSLASMLRRFGSNWQRAVAILATVLAILFAPSPPSSNRAAIPGHLTIITAINHNDLEQNQAGPHLAKSGVQHRHGHNSADHGHDLPTGPSAAGMAISINRSAWALALSSAVVTNQPSSIDRPPENVGSRLTFAATRHFNQRTVIALPARSAGRYSAV